MSQPSRASEDSILACLARHFPATHPSLLLGRGDDCAVLKAGTPLCVSSDLFLEDVHFRRSYFTPEEIGHKALAVNVSDIAACGGRPLAFTLALGLPDDVDALWLDRFFSGMAALAQEQRLALAGGDLSRSPFLHVSITIWGESYTGGDFLVRGGSMPGDSLFVVGRPGLARVGLQVLEKEGRAALEHWPAACAAHLLPVPQVDAGLMLARAGANARPPALMDLSDGIMRDLPRLLGRTGESRARREGDTAPPRTAAWARPSCCRRACSIPKWCAMPARTGSIPCTRPCWAARITPCWAPAPRTCCPSCMRPSPAS